MKQLLQYIKTGETKIIDVPIPTPGKGMALVRTAASLVSSGTERMVVEFAEKSLLAKAQSRPDLVAQLLEKARREGLLTTVEAALNRLDQPMKLGYSSAGTIESIGADINRFKIGQRVACAGGGYAVHAEYAVIPEQLLTPLPDSVDFESASFTTLGAIALHGFRLAKPQIGENVAVIGLGLLGLLTVAIAQAAGCQVLGIDLDHKRIKLARDMGAVSAMRDVAEDAALQMSRGKGIDKILICADSPSNDPIELAGIIARDRAKVVAVGAVGLNIPRKLYFEKEISLINSRSYGPGRYDKTYEERGIDYPIGYIRWTEGRNLQSFVDLLSQGKIHVKHLITHRFPIIQAEDAYRLITGKDERPYLGIVLKYDLEIQSPSIEHQKAIAIEKNTITKKRKKSVSLSLGVFGAGNFATAVMLPVINKISSIDPIGICSASGVNAQFAAKKFTYKYAAADQDVLLNDPSIDTIAILTPHQIHTSQIISALNANKHVFCEKPLATTYAQLEEVSNILRGIAKKNKQVFTIGFNRRFSKLAITMAKFIHQRTEPLMVSYRINAGYLPLDHWLHSPDEGGGRIIGEVCHFVDFLTFLVGMPPISVKAEGLPNRGRYLDDNIVLIFTFADGSVGTINYLANGDKSFPKERVEVFVGGRIAVLNDFRTLELINNGKRKMHRSAFRQDKGHKGEWDTFIDAVVNNGSPPIPYDQIIAVTRATFAAVKALKSGESISVN